MTAPCAILRPLLFAVALQAGAAHGQALGDPTRPPPEAMTTGPASAAAPVALAAEPQLQSILISKRPGGRRVAVIDGQTLRVGDKVDGARLVSLGDSEAVLERGGKRQVLRLFDEPPAVSGNAIPGKEAATKAGKAIAAPAIPQTAAAAKPLAIPAPAVVPKPQPAAPPVSTPNAPKAAPAPARGDPNLL